MRNIRRFLIACWVGASGYLPVVAQTDGQVAFQVTTITDGGTYSPRNVFAIWVTDAQTNFVKTLLCRANSQKRWLIQWNQNSGGDVTDGITGATRTSHGATNVIWNCRNSSGALVPDGQYRILVEFTERNGQGPYTTAVSFVKGSAPVSLSPANLPRFTGMSLTYTPLNSPPEIEPIPFQTVLDGQALTFSVTAIPTGGDPVTLTASNLPAGATFVANNTTGTFSWPVATPVGIYTSRFYAADKDGVTVREALIQVRVPGSSSLGVALGSPILLPDPPDTQNTPGDTFDLNESGSFASTTDEGGFGDFGRIFVNEDDQYLYLGADGCSMVGDNNAMILFLGINTLSTDQVTLWSQSGLPNGLDTLSNLRFTTPVDIAIVLGDEYGDGTYPNFNLGDGYDFGQGVYHLNANSFTAVAGASLAQFDGVAGQACATGDDDGNRLTDRWECAIPWSSLNAALGIHSVSELTLGGVFVNSTVSSSNRYISANVLGSDVLFHDARDGFNNPAFGRVSLTPLTVEPLGGYDVAVNGVLTDEGGAGTVIPVTVTVSNRQNATVTFPLTLTNLTASGPAVSVVVSNLLRASSREVVLAWDTSGLSPGNHLLRISAGVLPGETSTSDNILEHPITLRTPIHDLSVLSGTAPMLSAPGSSVPIAIEVANLGDFAETASVSLYDQTDEQSFGTFPPVSIAPQATTNLIIPWPSPGTSLGWHSLLVEVAASPGETSLLDNSVTVRSALASQVVTNRILLQNAVWRYNQEGLDLFATPWTSTNFYDDHWSEGASQLGYGLPVTTELANRDTVVHFLRTSLHVDLEPVEVRLSLARDDGVVLFLDGTELLRDNVPAGPLSATTQSTAPMLGTAQTAVTTHLLDPWAWTQGRHTLAASLHQSDSAASGEHPWINEFHYDNDDSDRNEGVEIAGPAGLDLSRYALYFYNGGNGSVYSNVTLYGTLPDQSGGAGTAWFAVRRIQNGAPDGMVLVVDGTGVVEFLSYEGTFTANNGPAAGMTSVNLPVYEHDIDEDDDQSLQRTGSGSQAQDFTWVGPRNHSRGAINSGQTITQDPADLYFLAAVDLVVPSLPVVRDVVVTELTPQREAFAGDVIPITLEVANHGNQTESFALLLVDAASGEILGTAEIAGLGAGEATQVMLDWNTAGLEPGAHDLSALIVQDGVTNLLGSLTASGVVAGSGVGIKPVDGSAAIGGHAVQTLLFDTWAVVGEGSTLSIIDLQQPDQPVRVAAIPLPGRIEALALRDTWLFTANGAYGVQVIDLSDPANPVHRQTLDTPGHASDLLVSGLNLWIADGVAGLRCADMTDPRQPVVLSQLFTGGSVSAIAANGNFLYLADAFEGLIVVNGSNPASPIRLGTAPAAGFGCDVIIQSSSQLWVPTREGRCLLVDVTDPTSPVITGGFVTGANHAQVLLDNDRLYLAASSSGLLVYDVTDPLNATPALTIATEGSALGVDARNGRLALADGTAGLRLFDLPSLTPRGQVETAGRAVRADFSGDFLFLAAGENGLRIYSLTNPALPVLSGTVQAIGNTRDVAVEGSLAVLADINGMAHLVNVENPAAPVSTGGWSVPGGEPLYRVGLYSNRVLAVGFDTAWLLDISSPANPSLLGTVELPTRILDADLDGPVAVLALGPEGVVMLDGLSTLAQLGTYRTPAPAEAVMLEGSLAWIATGEGWIALDVTDPANPQIQASHGGHHLASQLAAGGRYLAAGPQGGEVVMHDRTDIVMPVDISVISNLTALFRLAADGDRLAILQEDAGVVLTMLSGPDSDGDGLDDLWEQALVDADPNDAYTSITEILPGDDFDGDGLSNRQEYIAGSSAFDSGSVFMVETAPEISTRMKLRWPSAPGRTYTVLMSLSLSDSFEPVATGISASPPLNEITLPETAGQAAFFMVVVEP